VNRGRWNWRVTLPGEDRRRNIPLRLPGQKQALPESKGRDLAESIAWRIWEKGARQSLASKTHPDTLADVSARFLAWAATYYKRSDGTPTGEAYNCEVAMRSLVGPHGRRPIDEISHTDIVNARDELIEKGFTRGVVNQRVGIWKRFFAWALENRLCAAGTKSEVWAITSLKQGRSEAPEQRQVAPVPHWVVKAACRFAPASVGAMMQLQELTGMRPGELCACRGQDLSPWRDVLVYRPATHKTEHKGKPRVIVLGPRAQRVIQPYIKKRGYIFTPAMSVQERKLSNKTNDCWSVNNYAKSVGYAVAAARKAGIALPDWAPNQLRHSCGTRVRRKFGVAAARVVLGHSDGRSAITDRYTRESIEKELILAASGVMRVIG
jgi:integrase